VDSCEYGRGLFVPLRAIQFTNVQVSDTYQVSFKIGDYVKLSPQGSLNSIGLTGVVSYQAPEDMILVEIPADKTEEFSAFSYQPELPSRLWDKLADDDVSLSTTARKNFIGTIVLRLVQVSERGQTVPLSPQALEPALQHKQFGFALEAGKSLRPRSLVSQNSFGQRKYAS
jgi:hypothetical protein